MSPTTDPHAPDDPSVWYDLLARWQACWWAGRDPAPHDLCPDRPELWDALRADIARLKKLPRPDPDEPDPWPDVPGYVITGELGRGGMGVVLAAREVRLNRDVAIKLPLARGAMSKVARARFDREAEVTARLNHPGVPPVHQVGELADGRPFMVLRRIDGATLAARMAANRSAGEPHHGLLPHFHQFVRVVGYAHRRGVVHRDLKPANLMVGRHGDWLVMDWGLAKKLRASGRRRPDDAMVSRRLLADPPPGDDLTWQGQVLGTPAYMAPEQARGRVAGLRSDVFSLGAVLCELLTSRPVYGGGRSDEVLTRAAAGEYSEAAVRALRGSRADRHPWAVVAAKCLDRNPDARPDDADDLFRMLSERPLTAETVPFAMSQTVTNHPPADWQLPAGVDRGLWDYLHSREMVAGYDEQMRASPLAAADVAFCEQAFPQPGRLVDVGCGTGRLAVHFARRGFLCVGVDLSPEMLAQARANATAAGVMVDWVPANLTDLAELPDESFRYAACLFSTLGMVRGADNRRAAVAAMRRVLRPGGLLVLHAHNRHYRGLGLRGWRTGDLTMPQAYAGAALTLHHFTRGELGRLLAGAGFRVRRAEAINAAGRPVRWGGRWRAYGWLVEAEAVTP